MPAPRWFFRFMYDRECAALERRHDQPEHRELLVRAPARSGTTESGLTASGSSSSLMRRSLYWRLRAAFYTHVPGLVAFYDLDVLQRLVEGQGLTVVQRVDAGPSVTVLARA